MQRMLTVVLALVAAGCGGRVDTGAGRDNTAPLASGGFRVDGTHIYSPDGSEFHPVGINLLGPHSWWNAATVGLSDVVQNDWRLNIVRLNSCFDNGCNDNNWTINDDLDAIVNEYTSRHIVVMIALHQLTCAFPDDGQLAAAVAWWKDKASRYRDNPYVWFNLFNEPGYEDSANPRWLAIHQAVISAIRDQVGAANLIVLDGTQCGQEAHDWSTNLVDAAKSAFLSYADSVTRFNGTSYPGIVFSLHVYDQWGPDGTDAQRDARLGDFIDRVHATGHPLVIGEAGSWGNADPTEMKRRGTESAYRVAPARDVGIVAWHGQPFDGFNLVNEGGIAAVDDANTPTNLTWSGQLLWQLARSAFASSSPPAGGTLVGYGNNCVDVRGASSASGTPIQLWTCNGGANQQWSYDGGSLHGLGGKCLDVQWAGTANGTAIQLWDCNGTDAQKWTYVGGTFQSALGSKCLDLPGGITTDGTALQLWDCNGNPWQQWRLDP